jgi:hypothetical protein
MWWLGFAAGTIVVTLVLRRLVNGSASSSDIEVGGVSETWLAEQRAKKD